jgi:hypothetical protein
LDDDEDEDDDVVDTFEDQDMREQLQVVCKLLSTKSQRCDVTLAILGLEK